MFSDIYIIILCLGSLSILIHQIRIRQFLPWLTVFLCSGLLVQLLTIRYHDNNISIFKIYAIVSTLGALGFLKNSISNLKAKKLFTILKAFIVIYGALTGFLIESNGPISLYDVVLFHPLVVICSIAVLADYMKGSIAIDLSAKLRVVIVLCFIFYYSLGFPYLILINTHRDFLMENTFIREIFNYITLAFYVVVFTAVHFHLKFQSNGR